ncbi:hypothetical protein N7523_010276 [Penicillium sp. IBT 18751x]|nr:hypothetical protein N7523_010224 [Penicillium sp. IBT 18751x]KAJ6105195.1 hypothetical protein N7523_010269 [Penicillium sp. IBT 18751x]KAJ6105202.1 hypothetical protein N7523_010276 [Penicillium sp. IBT 18751x]
MAKIFSRICAWFGLEVVHVIVVRRSRHGDIRLLQSTIPPDHPTDISLTFGEVHEKPPKEKTGYHD